MVKSGRRKNCSYIAEFGNNFKGHGLFLENTHACPQLCEMITWTSKYVRYIPNSPGLYGYKYETIIQVRIAVIVQLQGPFSRNLHQNYQKYRQLGENGIAESETMGPLHNSAAGRPPAAGGYGRLRAVTGSLLATKLSFGNPNIHAISMRAVLVVCMFIPSPRPPLLSSIVLSKCGYWQD